MRIKGRSKKNIYVSRFKNPLRINGLVFKMLCEWLFLGLLKKFGANPIDSLFFGRIFIKFLHYPLSY